MNRENRGILYGMIIGDGNLYMQTPKSCVLTIGHSPRQREYLEHKQRLIHSILGGKEPWVGEYQSKNKKTGKTYTNIQLKKTHKYFRIMRRVLYPYGKKTYTRKMLNAINDHGLALWYCDDGSGTVCKNKSKTPCGAMTRISTCCSLEEIEIIRDWFKERYDIDIRFDLDKRSGLYSIRMNTTESRKFVAIVAPYIPDCMKYKIQHVDKYGPRAQGTLRGEDIV